MSTTTILAIAGLVLVVLAGVLLFAPARRRDTDVVSGDMSSETARRDRGPVALSETGEETPQTGREVELAAVGDAFVPWGGGGDDADATLGEWFRKRGEGRVFVVSPAIWVVVSLGAVELAGLIDIGDEDPVGRVGKVGHSRTSEGSLARLSRGGVGPARQVTSSTTLSIRRKSAPPVPVGRCSVRWRFEQSARTLSSATEAASDTVAGS